MVAFQMAEAPVNQTAGAGGVRVVFALYSLGDGSVKNDHELKKAMEMWCIFGVGIVFYGNCFVIQDRFGKRERDDIDIIFGIGAVAVFQCHLERNVHAVKPAEITFSVLHVYGGTGAAQRLKHT